MTDNAQEPPNAFLSYSWTSDEYSDRVLQLAEQLTADGVQVVLDRWDLREGQDKHVFMERAVTDPEIDKVLILIDPAYAEKADGRQGGVGTETLVISPEVYREADQEKFIPVILQRTETGEVQVPRYLEGRIYVDLSQSENEAREYERLVRNIHGKPELERPPLGKPPAYLEEDAERLRTGRALEQYRDGVRRGRPHQQALLTDYLDRLAEAIEDEVLDPGEVGEDYDVEAVRSIERLLPYRDEFVDLVRFLGRYVEEDESLQPLQQFFERVAQIRYGHRPTKYGDLEADNIGFIGWELFLYATAGLLMGERFGAVDVLLQPFYLKSWQGSGGLRSYSTLSNGFQLLDEVYNRRNEPKYYSYSSTMLRERATHRDFPFDILIEADLLLWFRAAASEDPGARWYPRTLVYAESIDHLRLFVRAKSRRFFRRFSAAVGFDAPDEVREAFEAIPEFMFFQVGNFWGGKDRYMALMNASELGSVP